MSLPDDGKPSAQGLEPQTQSPAEPPTAPGHAVKDDQQTGAQLEPQQGVKSAKCDIYPLLPHYTVIADFQNWDPDEDVKAEVFEEILGAKLGSDNVIGFWWKKFPPNTRFTFQVPYPAGDSMDKYTLISDAIFEYSGDAKIRTPVYHF